MVEESTFSIVSPDGILHEQHQHHRPGEHGQRPGRPGAGGNAVEIIGRDPAKAKELAAALGSAVFGTAGTTPAWPEVQILTIADEAGGWPG